MENIVPPTKQALAEAFSLSSEILQNIEKNEFPLTDTALKTSRLARLLNDFEHEQAMQLEASGYPMDSDNIMSPAHWQLALTRKLCNVIFFNYAANLNSRSAGVA